MIRTYEISVVVNVQDDRPDDPDGEFDNVTFAIAAAAKALTQRTEGYEDDEIMATIDARELL